MDTTFIKETIDAFPVICPLSDEEMFYLILDQRESADFVEEQNNLLFDGEAITKQYIASLEEIAKEMKFVYLNHDAIVFAGKSSHHENRKTRKNGNRNTKKAKRQHQSDRNHGKPVKKSDKKWWDEQSGTFYRWDEKKKIFSSPKKPKIHRNRKTFRDRLEVAMQDREKDFFMSECTGQYTEEAYYGYMDTDDGIFDYLDYLEYLKYCVKVDMALYKTAIPIR